MDYAKLNEILKKHKYYLDGKDGGCLANLQNADLRGADLWNAKLQGADLQGAKLQGADLQGADLWNAKLRGANLWGANLDFSCLPLKCGGLGWMIDKKKLPYNFYIIFAV
jgi:hypothetical protein